MNSKTSCIFSMQIPCTEKQTCRWVLKSSLVKILWYKQDLASIFKTVDNIHKLLLLIRNNPLLAGVQIPCIQPPYRYKISLLGISIKKLSLVTEKKKQKYTMAKCILPIGCRSTKTCNTGCKINTQKYFLKPHLSERDDFFSIHIQ